MMLGLPAFLSTLLVAVRPRQRSCLGYPNPINMTVIFRVCLNHLYSHRQNVYAPVSFRTVIIRLILSNNLQGAQKNRHHPKLNDADCSYHDLLRVNTFSESLIIPEVTEPVVDSGWRLPKLRYQIDSGFVPLSS